MKQAKAFSELVLLLIILQAVLIIIERLAGALLPQTSFAERMTVMSAMILLSGAVTFYAKLRKIGLSVFPERFGRLYVISTLIAAAILIASPANYTGGYKAILLLFYGSVVTPVFEELVFRGYLWSRLEAVLDRELYTYAWNVLLFTLWHLGYMLPQLAQGNRFAVLTKLAAGFVYVAVLGFVRLKCGNCYITMLLHGVMNVLMI